MGYSDDWQNRVVAGVYSINALFFLESTASKMFTQNDTHQSSWPGILQL